MNSNKKRNNLINRIKPDLKNSSRNLNNDEKFSEFDDNDIDNTSKIELNENSENTYKQTKKHKFIKLKIILILLVIFILIIAVKTGLFIAKWQKLASEMTANSPSIVLDSEGNEIAKIGSNKNKKNIDITSMPDNLVNAYVSIEDQRFYTHSGVDLKRTAAAIFSYVRHFGSSSFGGSSITQQLVKNLTGDSSSKITRKVNEWIKAYAIEGVMTKEEILESYLNIIYVGPNIYGVELGANYYFNKSVSDLSLAESAFLAGINNSPNSYNPFGDEDKTEKITKRTNAVLYKMLELEYINQSEYDNAKAEVANGLKFKKGKITSSSDSNIYSYHTDALINEVIEDVANKYNISETFAENYIEMSNLKIYSTQDSNIQTTIEKEFDKKKYKLKSASDSQVISQAAMVVMDNSSGKVLGCVGGIGEKTARGFNRAIQAYRQTGSAGKPLSVLIPAVDKKIITPATIYNDEPTTFNDGSEEGYAPTDYNKYRGEITVRKAVESSQNIPFVKIMEQITPKTSIEYMKKMGITSLTEKDENLNLALGGLDKGITPLEMAAAYATIANNGKYIEPSFYEKIESSNGKTIIKSKQDTHTAFSKQVAYIIKDLLTEPVTGSSGTANYCKINGIDVAAKTGTTNNDYDRWLCGFTPYYTAVTWFGFDLNETINFNHKNPAGQIWSSVMSSIHKNLGNKTFDAPKTGIETATICPDTGLLAYSGCKNAYVESFIKGTKPSTYCTKHSGSRLNKETTNTSSDTTSTNTDSSIIDSIIDSVKEETKGTIKNTIKDVTSSDSTTTTQPPTTEPETPAVPTAPTSPTSPTTPTASPATSTEPETPSATQNTSTSQNTTSSTATNEISDSTTSDDLIPGSSDDEFEQ